MKIFAEDRIIADNVDRADTGLSRLIGLMFKKNIDDGKGLFIPGCNWIHTLFMMDEIDVIYLDSKGMIVDAENNVRPWRLCKPRFKAKSTLELRKGSIRSKSLKIGEVLTCSV